MDGYFGVVEVGRVRGLYVGVEYGSGGLSFYFLFCFFESV